MSIVFSITLTLCCCIFATIMRGVWSDDNLSLLLISAATVNIIIFLNGVRTQLRLLSITTLFISGYVVVYYLIPLNLALGYKLKARYEYLLHMKESETFEIIVIATISIIFFMVGWLIKSIRGANDNNREADNIYNGYLELKTAPIEMLSISAFLLFLLSSGSYAAGVYTASDKSAISSYLYFAFQIIFTSNIYLYHLRNKGRQFLSFRRYVSSFSLVFRIFFTCFVLFMIWVGDRGPVMFFSLLTFGVYFIRHQDISVVRLVILIFLASSIFSIISSTRAVAPSERLHAIFSESAEDSGFFENGSLGENFTELAGSVGTFAYYLREVPANYDFAWGKYKALQMIQIVPGLAGMVIASGILELEFKDPSTFATYLIQGDNRRYGSGTNVLGDVYIDFGLPGVFTVMFLVGYIFRALDNVLVFGTNNKFIEITALVFLSGAIYLSRSYLLFYAPLVVMTFLFVTIYIRITKKGTYTLGT